jgi:two-component sensor histidine kinase
LKSDEAFASEYRLLQPDKSVRWVLARGYCLRDSEGRAIRLPGAAIDITSRKEAEQHRELLTDELNHRVKNTLAIMQAIAIQSLRDGMSMQEARSAFLARLKAVSNAHDLLTLKSWAGADLAAVIHAAVDAYAGSQGHVRIEGPSVRLTPSSALAITMAMNELATNATKYGSLSQANGRVDILWRVLENNLAIHCRKCGSYNTTNS